MTPCVEAVGRLRRGAVMHGTETIIGLDFASEPSVGVVCEMRSGEIVSIVEFLPTRPGEIIEGWGGLEVRS